jgi:hypothetical protein
VEEAGTHLENLTGMFGARRSVRRLSSSLTKRRMTEQAKADVDESADAITEFKQQIAEFQTRREELIAEINERWGKVVSDTAEIIVSPKKTDVYVNVFGVGWMPYYLVKTDADVLELPAFGAE